jgi:plastocyanin
MRKLLTVAAAVALLAGGSVALGRTAGVDITKNGFGDRSISVMSGDSVSWKNTDTVEHQLVVDRTGCKLSLQPGQSSSCTFTTPGTFTFNDPTASGTGFSGTLTVARRTRAPSRSRATARWSSSATR